MKIEIDDSAINKIQTHMTCRMTDIDREFIANCIFDIGLIAVNSALERHPHLTFGQLLTAYFRFVK